MNPRLYARGRDLSVDFQSTSPPRQSPA